MVPNRVERLADGRIARLVDGLVDKLVEEGVVHDGRVVEQIVQEPAVLALDGSARVVIDKLVAGGLGHLRAVLAGPQVQELRRRVGDGLRQVLGPIVANDGARRVRLVGPAVRTRYRRDHGKTERDAQQETKVAAERPKPVRSRITAGHSEHVAQLRRAFCGDVFCD